MAFGRFAGALTSLLSWAGTPMWLGGSVTVVAMSVYGRFFGDLSQPALYGFGTVFIGLATVGAVVPCATASGCRPAVPSGRSVCSPSSRSASCSTVPATGSTGSPPGDLTPTSATFIAVVPVLLYSFVGVELPSTAGEEMRDPRRDIPVAIARAGIGQALMYGLPILAVLVVLPAERVVSLHGLIDAMKTVFTYLLIFPASLALRLRRPHLERPFLAPGGRAGAWLITVLATGWSLLATAYLLWPGLGTADPDASLPVGFEGQRLQFELLVLSPLAAAVAAGAVFQLASRGHK